MSKLEKQIPEELVIRKAKYRVKNSDGKYEVVYLETSADQVEQTSDRVFVTPQEKTQITSNKEAIAAETQARTEAVNTINGKLDVINGNEETAGSISKALKDAKAYADEKVQEVNGANSALSGRVETVEQELEAVDGKISTAKTEAIEAAKSALEGSINAVDGKVTDLTSKVSANETEIANIKDVLSNSNSNTIVVETEAEIATANANPKVGDLAFVISSKRAYIYKGVETVTAKNAPEGWVVFDEITNELDLVAYLKKEEAEATYRKKVDKITEDDLITELSTKINNKADKSYVDSKVGEVNTALTDKEAALKAEDTKLNNRINKFAPVVSNEEPVETEAGHVWLELV